MKTLKCIKGFIGTEISAVDYLSNRVLTNEAETYKFYKRMKNKFGTTVSLVADYVPINKFKKRYHYPTDRLELLLPIINANGYKIDVKVKKPVNGKPLDLNMLSDKEPRDYQEPVIDKITGMVQGDRTLVCLPTGTGKTFSSCYALQKRGNKFLVYVLARYVDKWVSDIKEMFDIEDDELYVIVGKKKFDNLFALDKNAKAEKDSVDKVLALDKQTTDKIKVYVCSNRTMFTYIKDYMNTPDETKFTITPNNFLEYTGVDTVLIDEAHQEFENIFRTMVVLNPSILVGLSATFYPSDKEQGKMYDMLFPRTNYVGNIKVDPYVDTWAISYTLTDKDIKHTGNFGYSHVEFEKAIFRNKRMLKNYTDMVINVLNKLYMEDYRDGDKALLYFSTIDMVKHMQEAIMSVYKDTGDRYGRPFDVSTYISGDPYETIGDSDVIVSTLGKSSTALDIPNLTTVIMTVILNSESMNHQAFGRLRDLKEGREKFAFLYANNLSKHRHNAFSKIEMLNARMKDLHKIPYRGKI